MRRFLLSALVFAAVAAAFWFTGPDAGGERSATPSVTAPAEGSREIAAGRRYGPSVSLPGSLPGADVDDAEAETLPPATAEEPGGPDAEDDASGLSRSNGLDDVRLRGSTGGGGGGSDSSRARAGGREEADSPTEPPPAAVDEEMLDLEAEVADLAESLGLLDEQELEQQIDRALDGTDRSLTGPELDQAREDARRKVLADEAIIATWIDQRYGPDVSEADERRAHGWGRTLLSAEGKEERDQRLEETILHLRGLELEPIPRPSERSFSGTSVSRGGTDGQPRIGLSPLLSNDGSGSQEP